MSLLGWSGLAFNATCEKEIRKGQSQRGKAWGSGIFWVLVGYFSGPGDPEVRRYVFALGQADSSLARKNTRQVDSAWYKDESHEIAV